MSMHEPRARYPCRACGDNFTKNIQMEITNWGMNHQMSCIVTSVIRKFNKPKSWHPYTWPHVGGQKITKHKLSLGSSDVFRCDQCEQVNSMNPKTGIHTHSHTHRQTHTVVTSTEQNAKPTFVSKSTRKQDQRSTAPPLVSFIQLVNQSVNKSISQTVNRIGVTYLA